MECWTKGHGVYTCKSFVDKDVFSIIVQGHVRSAWVCILHLLTAIVIISADSHGGYRKKRKRNNLLPIYTAELFEKIYTRISSKIG